MTMEDMVGNPFHLSQIIYIVERLTATNHYNIWMVPAFQS